MQSRRGSSGGYIRLQRLGCRTPDLERDAGRNTKFDGLGENHGSIDKILLTPNLAGRLRLRRGGASFPFQRVAGAKASNRKLLLLEVAIERCFARDRRRHFNGFSGNAFANSSVGMTYAGVEEFDMLRVARIGNRDDAQRAHGCIRLHPRNDGAVLKAGAVGGEGVDGVGALDHDSFIGVGRRLRVGGRGCYSRSGRLGQYQGRRAKSNCSRSRKGAELQ